MRNNGNETSASPLIVMLACTSNQSIVCLFLGREGGKEGGREGHNYITWKNAACIEKG